MRTLLEVRVMRASIRSFIVVQCSLLPPDLLYIQIPLYQLLKTINKIEIQVTKSRERPHLFIIFCSLLLANKISSLVLLIKPLTCSSREQPLAAKLALCKIPFHLRASALSRITQNRRRYPPLFPPSTQTLLQIFNGFLVDQLSVFVASVLANNRAMHDELERQSSDRIGSWEKRRAARRIERFTCHVF